MKKIKPILLLVTLGASLTACTTNESSYSTEGIAKAQRMRAAAKINAELGIAYLQQKRAPRAKEKFLLALQEDPRSPIANGAMAYYWEVTGNNQLAEQYYLRAIHFAPDSGRALNNYGVFLCRTNRYKQSEKYLLAAANDVKYIQTAAAYENAGLCALGIPNDNRAITYFKKALEQDPSRPTSYYELAKLYKKHGNNALARRYYAGYMAIKQSDIAPLSFNNFTVKNRNDKTFNQ